MVKFHNKRNLVPKKCNFYTTPRHTLAWHNTSIRSFSNSVRSSVMHRAAHNTQACQQSFRLPVEILCQTLDLSDVRGRHQKVFSSTLNKAMIVTTDYPKLGVTMWNSVVFTVGESPKVMSFVEEKEFQENQSPPQF